MKKLPKRSLIGVAVLCVLPAAVQAQLQPTEPYTGDTLQFRVGAGLERDSNVLRTPNGSPDEVGVLAAGVRFDKQISLQRITIDAEVAAHRHNNFEDLNFETLNYNGAWNFQVTPRFRGLVSADRRQFREITDTVGGRSRIDLRTQRTEQAEGLYEIGGGWRAVASVLQTHNRSEEPRAFEASPTIRSARVGGGYEFGSGAQVFARYRFGDGEYGNAIVGRNFRETEPDIVVRWPITARTTVDGGLGYLRREHEGAGFRDFSGAVFKANASWDITAKTRLTGGFAREIGSYEFLNGGNVRTSRAYVGPMWMPTELITVNLRYEREQREWNVVDPTAPDIGRRDVTHFSSATVEWSPRRYLTLTASLRGERRDSNLAPVNYDATIFGVGARLTF